METDKTESHDTETPLERICALPEHIADRELTANQERARFIARDVRDYTEKAPAGLVIDSRANKRVCLPLKGSVRTRKQWPASWSSSMSSENRKSSRRSAGTRSSSSSILRRPIDITVVLIRGTARSPRRSDRNGLTTHRRE